MPSRAIRVEVVTTTHRLTGEVCLGERRLSDVLNVDDEPYLTLDSASAAPLDQAAVATPIDGPMLVSKSAIVFAIPLDDDVGGPSSPAYIPKLQHRAHIVLPPFQIVGHLHAGQDIGRWHDALRVLNFKFAPLSQAQVRHLHRPELQWTAAVVIVNRLQAHIFWLEEPASV